MHKIVNLIETVFLLAFIKLSIAHSFPVTRHISTVKTSTGCSVVGSNNQTILGFGNCFNNIYFIDIEIGTPPQTLGVQFDTGSNILWVPTQLVSSATSFFNTSKSSTFTNTSSPGGVQYVDGSGVTGTFGTDLFQIPNSLIDMTTTYLWVYSEVGISYPSAIQGLVGMGFTNTPNFLDVAYQQGEIQTPIFALQILDDTEQSLIHYNEIPEEILNSTYFQPVSSTFYWGVEVTKVTVDDTDLTAISANLAVIDSGTSFFYLNPELFKQIESKYFSACQTVQNIPICPCNSTANWPNFTFTFKTIEVYIQPQDYIFTYTSQFCSYNFGSISGSFSQILLGDIFFRNYIITFDKINQQIGFSSSRVTPLDIVEVNADLIIGWVLLATIGLVILIGVLACCCIQAGINGFIQKTGGIQPQFQLSQSPGLREKLNY